MRTLIKMLMLYRSSFLIDNFLYIFAYIFILNTDIFWDLIYCEKMKVLYDNRYKLNELEREEIEVNFILAVKALAYKRKKYKLFIYLFIVIILFIFVVLLFEGTSISYQRLITLTGVCIVITGILFDMYIVKIYIKSIWKFFNLLEVSE